jgi:hypothetical protein
MTAANTKRAWTWTWRWTRAPKRMRPKNRRMTVPYPRRSVTLRLSRPRRLPRP